MAKLTVSLCFLLFVFVSSPVKAELGDQILGNLTKRAWGCGKVSQIVKVLQIEDHYPNFKERFLNFAKSRGASGWELNALDSVFEVGIQDAIDEGFAVGPEISEEDQEYAIEGFDKKIYRCWGFQPKP